MATPEFFPAKKDQTIGKEWPAQHSALSKAFEIFCTSLFKFYCPLTVYNAQNLPEAPFIMCANHTSHLDSVMLIKASALPFRRVGLIAAKDYFFDQSHRFYLHYMMNLVPIARGTGTRAIKDSIVACRSFLDSGGEALVIFPEGTRSPSGKIARFKEGASLLAHELDLPLVPSCITGSYDSLPKGSYFIRPKKVTVRFGRAFKVSDWLSFDEKEDRKAIFNAYREATLELERQVGQMAEEGKKDEE